MVPVEWVRRHAARFRAHRLPRPEGKHELLLHGSSGRPTWRSGSDCRWSAWCPSYASCARPAPLYGQLLPSDH
eukprot:2718693-Lingulodinium_polyedra.AAC.1